MNQQPKITDKMNYNGKRFRPISNSDNGELGDDMFFEYRQEGNILSCTYSGGTVVSGHLIGKVSEKGEIEMAYHQINKANEIRTGVCHSKPELMADGRVRLHESWRWTNGDQSAGASVLEEIP